MEDFRLTVARDADQEGRKCAHKSKSVAKSHLVKTRRDRKSKDKPTDPILPKNKTPQDSVLLAEFPWRSSHELFAM